MAASGGHPLAVSEACVVICWQHMETWWENAQWNVGTSHHLSFPSQYRKYCVPWQKMKGISLEEARKTLVSVTCYDKQLSISHCSDTSRHSCKLAITTVNAFTQTATPVYPWFICQRLRYLFKACLCGGNLKWISLARQWDCFDASRVIVCRLQKLFIPIHRVKVWMERLYGFLEVSQGTGLISYTFCEQKHAYLSKLIGLQYISKEH